MSAYRIKVEKQQTASGRSIYACMLRVVKQSLHCEQGRCGVHYPASSPEQVIEKVRSELADIRDGGWERPDDPLPTIENTELVDETGMFALGDFFDAPTLQSFMQTGEARGGSG